jgi:cobalt-zinc-cadmium efflux system membrane fusion protein
MSCSTKVSDKGRNVTVDDSENTYKIDTVKLTPQHNEISLTGTIDFDQDKIVKVYSLVTGRINEVKVDLGTHVTKDQILADVNSPDVLNLTNDFQQDKLNL